MLLVSHLRNPSLTPGHFTETELADLCQSSWPCQPHGAGSGPGENSAKWPVGLESHWPRVESQLCQALAGCVGLLNLLEFSLGNGVVVLPVFEGHQEAELWGSWSRASSLKGPHFHHYHLSSSVSLSLQWPQAWVGPCPLPGVWLCQVQDLVASVENRVGSACASPLSPDAPTVKGAVSPSSPCPVLGVEGSKVTGATGCCILGAVPSEAHTVHSNRRAQAQLSLGS